MLAPHLQAVNAGEPALRQLEDWSEQGLRVLAFAHQPAASALPRFDGQPGLPELALLGVVSLRDELRPHLEDTLADFAASGVALKIISGDSPKTVTALARQAGLKGELAGVSGPELARMDPAQFRQAAAGATIYGRISPEQKEQLVAALRAQGEYVAMVGDGVNDVLSLKQANLGIAMESGSAATRGVADLILLGDTFEALLAALPKASASSTG
jgi:cation-transporting ATPase E